jgi:hypothetical protein
MQRHITAMLTSSSSRPTAADITTTAAAKAGSKVAAARTSPTATATTRVTSSGFAQPATIAVPSAVPHTATGQKAVSQLIQWYNNSNTGTNPIVPPRPHFLGIPVAHARAAARAAAPAAAPAPATARAPAAGPAPAAPTRAPGAPARAAVGSCSVKGWTYV